MRLFLGLSALVGLSAASSKLSVSKQLDGDRVLRLYHDGKVREGQAVLDEFVAGFDMWGTQADGAVDMRVPASALDLLPHLGFNYTDVTDETAAHLEWMGDPANKQVCEHEGCALGDDFYTAYQRLDAIHGRIRDIAATSDIADIFSIGQSFENRDQLGISIRTGAAKPAVVYFCGTHAREWLPPMFCTFMAENFVAQYNAQDSRVLAALDNFDIYIIPLLNPDGYEWTHTDANLWRKTREPNGGAFNCIGTDLNRNYEAYWGTGGSSDNPCTDTFMGLTPLSSIEIFNLDRWAQGLANGAGIAIQVDVHAYGRMWMHPWGWTRDLSSDDQRMQTCGDATADAIRDTHGLDFATGSIANVIYVASGSSCDHFYHKFGTIYAYAPEVRGNSFQPFASNIIPSNEELWEGMMAGVECAL